MYGIYDFKRRASYPFRAILMLLNKDVDTVGNLRLSRAQSELSSQNGQNPGCNPKCLNSKVQHVDGLVVLIIVGVQRHFDCRFITFLPKIMNILLYWLHNSMENNRRDQTS
jgi:hypothetical protein